MNAGVFYKSEPEAERLRCDGDGVAPVYAQAFPTIREGDNQMNKRLVFAILVSCFALVYFFQNSLF